MKIAIIGATGKAGHLILEEALARGNHEVTAIVRNRAKLGETTAKVMEKDLFDLEESDLIGQDIVIDAFNAPAGKEELHVASLAHLTTLLEGHPEVRLLIVGGAGSLYVDQEETIRVMDTPDFPAAFLPTASNMGKAFDTLRQNQQLNWTYLSPAAFFNYEGERTGTYQTGGNQLRVNAAGQSEISYADYAIAMIDEAEKGEHIRARFSVVSQ
ncbi:NAD(P)-dependent oxidoreductase [Listeria costaricensis]|uniref:NAD(P)-dependent oxidoreductase n=1 Tax=Listeria costaricensis TaxID=2026604 RepID=UPI000C080CBA|nr:NAD(P)-dependent oxidoreductase [Listeria costaricensis]